MFFFFFKTKVIFLKQIFYNFFYTLIVFEGRISDVNIEYGWSLSWLNHFLEFARLVIEINSRGYPGTTTVRNH